MQPAAVEKLISCSAAAVAAAACAAGPCCKSRSLHSFSYLFIARSFSANAAAAAANNSLWKIKLDPKLVPANILPSAYFFYRSKCLYWYNLQGTSSIHKKLQL